MPGKVKCRAKPAALGELPGECSKSHRHIRRMMICLHQAPLLVSSVLISRRRDEKREQRQAAFFGHALEVLVFQVRARRQAASQRHTPLPALHPAQSVCPGERGEAFLLPHCFLFFSFSFFMAGERQ